jgi:hypothetical protein
MAAFEAIQREGVTEREVCAAGTAACLRAGADFVRYFRVHSGPWSAAGSRWPQAMDRPIRAHEVVVLDAIGAVGGYGFDVNRTAVKGGQRTSTSTCWNSSSEPPKPPSPPASPTLPSDGGRNGVWTCSGPLPGPVRSGR